MKYIIAVKREARETLGENLLEIVSHTPGVEPVGNSPSPWRLQVEATPEGIEALKDAGENKLLIEPIVYHDAFSAGQNV